MRNYREMDMGWGRLAYRKFDPDPDLTAEAVPMMLLHGGGGDGTTWDDLVATFAERRTVYVPDLRGMGRSDRAGPYSMTVMRDVVLLLLDRLALDRVILVGHSLGGFAAMLAAQAAPHRVTALVLEECPPPVPLGIAVPADLDDSAPYYDREIRPSILRDLNAPDPAWWRSLDTITAPTLVLAGGRASFLPQDTIAAVAARIPAGRLVTIEAGHQIHRDAPDEFVAAVNSFLGAAADGAQERCCE
ncbi:alpha/beta hydrolase [Actinoplanes sp. NBC_00393]|uniref:alpha/beta fold hydrolase n=1 Tax=Actinoplanes sp. NBC_00393 TaxID=2975953 RepID=UPI002E23C29D